MTDGVTSTDIKFWLSNVQITLQLSGSYITMYELSSAQYPVMMFNIDELSALGVEQNIILAHNFICKCVYYVIT